MVVAEARRALAPSPAEHRRRWHRPAPACFGDKRCANERASRCEGRTRRRRRPSPRCDRAPVGLRPRRLRRATESPGYRALRSRSREEPDLGRAIDDAVRGRLGYCALAARKTTTQPSPGSAIRLERHGCYGSCGIYDVEVRIDGLVVWEGAGMVVSSAMPAPHRSPACARELFDASRAPGLRHVRRARQRHRRRPVVDVTIVMGGTTRSTTTRHARHSVGPDGTCYLSAASTRSRRPRLDLRPPRPVSVHVTGCRRQSARDLSP